jgi:hypothetical protein
MIIIFHCLCLYSFVFKLILNVFFKNTVTNQFHMVHNASHCAMTLYNMDHTLAERKADTYNIVHSVSYTNVVLLVRATLLQCYQ